MKDKPISMKKNLAPKIRSIKGIKKDPSKKLVPKIIFKPKRPTSK